MGIERQYQTLTSYKCKLHNLTGLMANQDLLTHFRRDITGEYEFMGSNHYNTDQDFPEIPQDEPFDAAKFLDIYEVQYQLVNNLCAAGVQVNMEQLTDAQRERHQFIMNQLVKDRPTPNEMHQLVDHVLKTCHEGDIIDVMGYRGTGYNLVKSKRDWIEAGSRHVEVKCIKTVGPYGCHLPEIGWDWVSLYGPDFYEKCDLWGCRLPAGTCYMIVDRNQDGETNEHQLYSWLEKQHLLNIDGHEVIGKIIDAEQSHAICSNDDRPIML